MGCQSFCAKGFPARDNLASRIRQGQYWKSSPQKQASCAQFATQQQNGEKATHPAGSEAEQTTVRTSQAKQEEDVMLYISIFLCHGQEHSLSYDVAREIYFIFLLIQGEVLENALTAREFWWRPEGHGNLMNNV
jgi:hypothetical protein